MQAVGAQMITKNKFKEIMNAMNFEPQHLNVLFAYAAAKADLADRCESIPAAVGQPGPGAKPGPGAAMPAEEVT